MQSTRMYSTISVIVGLILLPACGGSGQKPGLSQSTLERRVENIRSHCKEVSDYFKVESEIFGSFGQIEELSEEQELSLTHKLKREIAKKYKDYKENRSKVGYVFKCLFLDPRSFAATENNPYTWYEQTVETHKNLFEKQEKTLSKAFENHELAPKVKNSLTMLNFIRKQVTILFADQLAAEKRQAF